MSQSNITKKALADSLKKLAGERLFENITVNDIVKECGVNRQTFYYHFHDRYELLDWIYYTETFVPLTGDISLENWDEKLAELLQIIKQNKSFYMNTIKCSNNYFQEYLHKMLVTLNLTLLRNFDSGNTIAEYKLQLYARVFSYGLAGVITEWALNGMKENEHALAAALKELTDIVEKLGFEIYNIKQTDPELLAVRYPEVMKPGMVDVNFNEI